MMDAALRAFVRERASRRCEYCRLHEDDYDIFAFHVKHVIAKQHGGFDDPDMLCWASLESNWAKGPNLACSAASCIRSSTQKQNWHRRFRWEQTNLVGKTKTGIVTVRVLNINDPARVMLQENLLFEGRFPPEA
jgi:hypothetical protein